MADISKLKAMALDIYNKVPTEYSVDTMEDALRAEINQMVKNEDGTINFYKFQQNKQFIFELMSEIIDTIMPKKVLDIMGKFADVETFTQGSKPRFQIKKGKNRVKNFVTKVGAGGNYEVARLDSTYVDMTIEAHGGAVQVRLERFLDGKESLTELLDLLIEGIEDAIYTDVQTALKATLNSVPANNKHSHNAFSDTDMKRIITTVTAYGVPNIFSTPEFAATITPSTSYVADADRNDLREKGYVGKYSGANVVVLPQSFTDETNVTKVIDPEYAYIIPSNDEKIVKIAMEGQTIIEEVKNADNSMEFQVYKKYGIVVLHTNHFGVYRNTAL